MEDKTLYCLQAWDPYPTVFGGISMTANNKNYDEAEERLFEAGVPSYLDAMVALREFRNIVSQKCRTVLTSHLAKFDRQ